MTSQIKLTKIGHVTQRKKIGPHNQRGCSSSVIAVLFLNILPLLLTLFISPSAITAQTDLEADRAAFSRLMAEALKLRQDGTRDSLEASILKLTDALKIIRSLGDRPFEASILFAVGSTYRQLGDNQRALEYYLEALPVFRATVNPKGEAVTLNNIGDVYGYLGNQIKALESYSQALSLRRSIGDGKGEAVSLNDIGLTHSGLGEQEKALGFFVQSRSVSQAIGDRMGEATALSNIGVVYGRLGDEEKSLDYLMQALPLRRAVGDREGEAVTLQAVGSCYNSLGEKQKALNFYAESLSVAQAIGNRQSESTTLNNIGELYDSIGETDKALAYFSRALPLKRAIGDRRGEASALSNIGAVYSRVGETEKALACFAQAQALFLATADRAAEAAIYNNIGSVYDARGQRRAALESYTKSLTLSRAIGNRSTEATALNNIAGIYDDSGDKQKAMGYYEQALSLLRELGDRRHEAGALSNIASLEGNRGNLKEAFLRMNQAIDILESLRGKIGSQESRSAFFASVHNNYEFLIGLLVRLHKQNPTAGYEGTALQTSERARARGLLELLNDAHADIRKGVDSKLLDEERALQRRLNAKAESRTILLTGPHDAQQASAAAMEIEELTTDYQNLETKIRQTSPGYAALTQPQSLDLKGIQTQLDTDTLVLEYALGNVQSFLWLVSSSDIETFELPARKEIEAATRGYYELLTTVTDAQDKQMVEAASRLSQMLIGPVGSKLGEKRLVIVADGALQYLPFAALPDPAPAKQSEGTLTPLILRHEIVSLPSVSILASLRKELAGRPPAPKDIVVLADPVFSADDMRVRGNTSHRRPDEQKASATVADLAGERASLESGARRDGNHLERLPGTRREANNILALVPTNRAMAALDFAASRELVRSGELGHYRFVTFATHGLLDSVHPELSAIVLSLVDENGNRRDGYLRAHEIYNLDLPVDLVVLSACKTALGKDVKGEGLLGLTRGFMYAGAPRVVASLWSVKDESTARLIVSFYRSIIKGRMRPAAALRAAQIEMLQSKDWQSPHYWAAFVLQGEWR
jgi:CHAT domain-containing protein/Flp pilus assembly protein TadD